MGVVANTKQFLARKAMEAVQKANDGISNFSELSPKQLQEIDDRRRKYLREMPDMSNQAVLSTIQNNMGAVGIEVYQEYLEQLGKIYLPIDIALENFDEDNRIRFFDITKWVTDAEERNLDKLVNVYHVLSEEDCNIALIYHRDKNKCRVTIGIVNTDEKNSDPAIVDKYYSRVVGAIKGNFPGADLQGAGSLDNDFGIGIPTSLLSIAGNGIEGKVKSIAVVSNVASEKSENFISQSMEKILDGIVPENETQDYTIVLLAKPVRNQFEEKNRLYELYTALKPYETWQINTGVSQNATEGSSFVLGSNLGINVSKGTGTNMGVSAPTPVGIANIGTHTNHSIGGNFGISFQRSSNVSVTIGKNESLTQSFTNYGIKHTLEIIESQIKRIEESSALGMWEFAAYMISDSPVIANNVAHMYLALTQGEQSYLTKAAVNFWDGDIEPKSTKVILSSIQKLQHPIFGLKTSLEDEWLMYPTLVTPSTCLSGKELAKALNFPRKSVSGLPVLDVVSFGREPHSLIKENLDLEIGCGYHMRKMIPEQRIALSREELAKHTFITGSTGSGKSNTIYKILEGLAESGVHFLVIEPAKGEYRDTVGKLSNVETYGTNPNIANVQMLRMNPFRFPKHIHILEHLDRLVEIFNVCWPMYAAMPAILKDSIERAYINAGWNLEKSINKYDCELFPSFSDVVKQIKVVLSESDYSADNKGDYTGSLTTRLLSLTNGINGLIFTSDDIEDEELFDQNAIVDLSRVGSSETKALIMGLLILKLQEHRMEQRATGAKTDDVLNHVTILEEAHNILKKTSTEQYSESANIAGKSVEMLANSIAEMRTYGEGFIVADQSPGLLDLSVIRNTNTKIILRLPDYSDRLLVGKAAGLSDSQINELTRLEKGVAAITQSDWLEPVLCKLDKFQGMTSAFQIGKSKRKHLSVNSSIVKKSLLDCIMSREIYRTGDRVDIQNLKKSVLRSKLDTRIKCSYIDYISADSQDSLKALRNLIYEFLNAENAIEKSRKCDSFEEWIHQVVINLTPELTQYSKQQIDLVLDLVIHEQYRRDSSYGNLFLKFVEKYQTEGGVY